MSNTIARLDSAKLDSAVKELAVKVTALEETVTDIKGTYDNLLNDETFKGEFAGRFIVAGNFLYMCVSGLRETLANGLSSVSKTAALYFAADSDASSGIEDKSDSSVPTVSVWNNAI